MANDNHNGPVKSDFDINDNIVHIISYYSYLTECLN